LIPDFFLLFVKLYTVAKNAHHLFANYETSSLYEKISAFSKASEGLLFSLFLILLFIGKLIHTRRVYSKNYPFVCMRLLIACFPITAGLEALKAFIKIQMSTDTFVWFFELSKNILNEAFLDLPYFLLLLLMAFVPETRH
jgi:tellurite resistance protein TehA-like permease